MTTRRLRGEGSIFYVDSKNMWTAEVFLPNGKRKRKYCRTRKLAKDWLLEQRKAIKDSVWVDQENITLATFLDRYMADVAEHTLRPKTLEVYHILIRVHIKPELGQMKLTRLSPLHLQNLYSLKLKQNLSARTVQFIHSILHRALKQALRWGLVSRNVAGLVDAPSVKRKAPEMLTVDQVKILLDTVQYDRLYSLYVLAVTTGMREGELLGLHWEDVDFLMGTI